MPLEISNPASNSNLSYTVHSPSNESSRSKRSQYSDSFTSEHGSKFGRSVSKFPKQNDPSLVQAVSIVNSRVIHTIINFSSKIDQPLPDLQFTEATDCIRELGSFMNILDYEFNYTSFWLLDIISKLIKHMQLKGLSVVHQNICLAWFKYVLRCISGSRKTWNYLMSVWFDIFYIVVSGDSREDIFSLLRKMFLKAEDSIKSGGSVPQPEEIDIEEKSIELAAGDLGSLHSSRSLHSKSSRQSQKKFSQKSSRSSHKLSRISHTSNRSRSNKSLKLRPKTSSEYQVETNLQTLNYVIEMIYYVFADRFMFSQISQAYSSPTIVEPVEIPIDFRDPKLLRPILAVTPPVSPTSQSKDGKKGKDKKKSKGGKTEDKNAKSEKGKKSKDKGDGKGRKGKRSKSSGDTQTAQDGENKEIKSGSLDELQKIKMQQIEEKMKLLFDKPLDPDKKLEQKKIEVKDKFILPLSEGVQKGYVENLIKSLLPRENKQTENDQAPKGKGEKKSSSGVEPKKKKSSKSDKKSKGKKK